ncbi:MAG: hypothetical protein ACP5KW_10005 [Thermoproteota archaeon]
MKSEKFRENQNEREEEENKLQKEVEYLKAEIENLAKALGVTYEDYATSLVRIMLEDKGYQREKINVRKTMIVHNNKIVEVDIFNEDPLVVGDVTTYLGTVEQAREEIHKILYDEEVVERKFKRKVEYKVLAVANAPSNVLEELRKLTKESNITFIFGREVVQEI